MSIPKGLDYIVEWAGDGDPNGQDVPLGYPPRSVQAIGAPPPAVPAGALAISSIVGLCVEMPAGLVSNAIVAGAAGFRVSGQANLAGWSYSAIVAP